MDGTKFDDLIKGLGTKRLTRMSALRGLAASAAAAVTGVTLFSEGTEAKNSRVSAEHNLGRKKPICHCLNESPASCTTIKPRKRARKKHLKHPCDYPGACTPGVTGCPATATGGGPQPAGGCTFDGDCAAAGLSCCIGGFCSDYACAEVCVLEPEQSCCNDVVVPGNCPDDTCTADPCSGDYNCNTYVDGCKCRDIDSYTGYGTCQIKGVE